MTYRELRLWLRQELSGRENLDQEIRWLIEAFSGKNILDIGPEEEVSRPVFYEKAVKRLQHHEPFQYVVGSQEFYGGVFLVTPAVLVPRPETELLVEEALRWAKGKDALEILDLCTGSGCIGISLARETESPVLAIDISEDALRVAEKNNALNGTAVDFRYSDLFYHIPKERTFDLITANPPYLTQQEMKEIPLEVTYEPLLALDGGPNGLFAIERILKELDRRLNPGGLFLMEIGEGQGNITLALAEKYDLPGAKILKDLNEKDRIFRWGKKSE